MTALAENGHRALGWRDAGTIAVGQRADLVAVRLDTVRTVGSLPDQILLTAFAADVDTVVVDGRVVVSGGRHRSFDVAAELHASIRAVWDHPEATR
jgi:cytosine/adenosine deaminase-related metal-dependent hydrolase